MNGFIPLMNNNHYGLDLKDRLFQERRKILFQEKKKKGIEEKQSGHERIK